MSFTKLIYHIVFSTKSRQNTIPVNFERDLYALILHIVNKQNGHLHRIGGMPDHIHMLVDVPTNISVANFVKKIKQESSFLMAQNPNFPKWSGWEEGYGAFTYSVAEIPTVKAYIKNQKEHHRRVSFIEEYRSWLIEMGVSPDEPYFPKLD